ncbi:MAG TPA: hypothetical protein VHB49_07815 [Bradyrhizobium sp.]|nr:hypothetical protein [Bradyrhizobium sp.]
MASPEISLEIMMAGLNIRAVAFAEQKPESETAAQYVNMLEPE